MTIFTARVCFEKTNTTYPDRVTIQDAFDFDEVKTVDHVCCEYKDNYRANENFISTDWLYGDINNSHSENPADWLTVEGFQEKFKEFDYYLLTSRNHMKEKDGKAPRPRFHVYFPLRKPILKAKQLSWYLGLLIRKFAPYFDSRVKDAARFFYGSPDGQVFYGRGRSILGSLVEYWRTEPKPEKREKRVPLDEMATGNRNDTLFRFGCQLRRNGLNEEEISGHLMLRNDQLGGEALKEEEVARIAKSAASYNDRDGNPDFDGKRAESRVGDSKPPKMGIKYWYGKELMATVFQPPLWIIANLLIAGLSILAGTIKLGKSWMFLEIALRISQGLEMWGKKITKAKVLYLALEDTAARIQSRCQKLGIMPDDNLIIVTKSDYKDYIGFNVRGDAAIAELERKLKEDPDIKVVLIDTLNRFLGVKDSKNYDETYDEAGKLKQFADRQCIVIAATHHLRKGDVQGEDYADKIMGSVGYAAAADTVEVLKRRNVRQESDSKNKYADLQLRGRDVEEQEYVLLFNDENCRWEMVGDVDQVQMSEARYEITTLLMESEKPLMPNQIATRLNKNANTVRGLLKKMKDDGGVMVDKEGGYYIGYFPEVSQNNNSVNAVNVNTVNGSTEPMAGDSLFTLFTLSTASAGNEQSVVASTSGADTAGTPTGDSSPFTLFTLSTASAGNEQAIPAPTPESGNGQKPYSASASTNTAESQNVAPDPLPTTGNGQPPEELVTEGQDAVAEPAAAADDAWNQVVKEMGRESEN